MKEEVLNTEEKTEIEETVVAEEVETAPIEEVEEVEATEEKEDDTFGAFAKSDRAITGKFSTIITFNQTLTPYFELMFFDNDEFVRSEIMPINANTLENGLPKDVDSLAATLKAALPSTVKEVVCLVDSDSIFKWTYAVPKVSVFQRNALYQRDLKNNFGEIKNRYTTIIENSKSDNGGIVYTYFIPIAINNFFVKLTKAMGVKLVKLLTYPNYIFNCVKADFGNQPFVYCYTHNKLITSIISYNGCLAGYFTTYNKQDYMKAYFYGYVGKHFYELEKIEIENVHSNVKTLKTNIMKTVEHEIVFKYSYTK